MVSTPSTAESGASDTYRYSPFINYHSGCKSKFLILKKKLMKFKYLVCFGIAGSLVLAGCKKDFLQTEPTQFTTPEQLANSAKQDPKVLNGLVSGLYTTMFYRGCGWYHWP
jgi:hypothetical protein